MEQQQFIFHWPPNEFTIKCFVSSLIVVAVSALLIRKFLRDKQQTNQKLLQKKSSHNLLQTQGGGGGGGGDGSLLTTENVLAHVRRSTSEPDTLGGGDTNSNNNNNHHSNNNSTNNNKFAADLSAFVTRLRLVGFAVLRIKKKQEKLKRMKVNEAGDFALYEEGSTWSWKKKSTPVPLQSLLSVLDGESSPPSFILQFKSKIYHLRMPESEFPFNAASMVSYFHVLAVRLHADPSYLKNVLEKASELSKRQRGGGGGGGGGGVLVPTLSPSGGNSNSHSSNNNNNNNESGILGQGNISERQPGLEVSTRSVGFASASPSAAPTTTTTTTATMTTPTATRRQRGGQQEEEDVVSVVSTSTMSTAYNTQHLTPQPMGNR